MPTSGGTDDAHNEQAAQCTYRLCTLSPGATLRLMQWPDCSFIESSITEIRATSVERKPVEYALSKNEVIRFPR